MRTIIWKHCSRCNTNHITNNFVSYLENVRNPVSRYRCMNSDEGTKEQTEQRNEWTDERTIEWLKEMDEWRKKKMNENLNKNWIKTRVYQFNELRSQKTITSLLFTRESLANLSLSNVQEKLHLIEPNVCIISYSDHESTKKKGLS